MAKRFYVYPEIIRSGLGNNLLAWSRAQIFAEKHGLPRLASHWFKFKIGPILRRERDWRWYGTLFHNGDAIAGLRRAWLLKRCEQHVETDVDRVYEETPDDGKPRIIRFNFNLFGKLPVTGYEQMGFMFDHVVPHADFIHKRLLTIVRKEHIDRATSTLNEPFLAIHYRRGDKPSLPYLTPYPTDTDHPTLPAEWYAGALKAARGALGYDLPAVVFTDGTAEQAKLLLDQPNVRLADANNAIVDILLMAKCKLFISTFSSSFSHMSAMLSKAPALHYPGRSFSLVHGHPERTIFTQLDGAIDDASAAVIRDAVGTKSDLMNASVR